MPEDVDDRERHHWWKAKKWAYSILGRLFHRCRPFLCLFQLDMVLNGDRYGNPSQLPSTMKKDYQAFAEHFVNHFAPEIFKTYLRQVELFVSGQQWLSKKAQYNIFSFFTEWCVMASLHASHFIIDIFVIL